MASQPNGTLYVGATSDLVQRVWQHKASVTEGFTSRYGCKTLVYYEQHEEMRSAIEREKQIKAGRRAKKLAMIEASNPTWRDLYDELL